MHPDAGKRGQPIFECFGCGRRARDPENRVCSACGSAMRNIGQPRDR